MALSFVKIFYDWPETTEELSDEERGRLVTAIVEYARTGVSPKLKGAERILFPAFKSQIDRDTSAYQERSERCSEAGMRGGRPRKGNAFSEKGEKPTLLKKGSKSEKSQEEEKEKEIYTPYSPPQGDERGTDSSSDLGAGKYPTAFEAFWAAYPRKVGKGAALKAWRRISAPASALPAMLTSLEWQRESEQWQRDGGQYIPHPATWLNQSRWEDERPDTYGPYDDSEVIL